MQRVVQNSTWEQDGAIYRLQSCPSGYSVFPVLVDASNAALQECLPCPEGTECVLETCTTCSHCTAGTYKDVAGTQACRACPQNTYNPDVNSKAFANCVTCPQGAETGGIDRQTSLDACQCSDRMYSTQLEPIFTCVTCPSGAMCMGDGTCALQNPSKQCGTGVRIKGSWLRLPASGKFAVIGCPVGYKLNNLTGHDAQSCQQCVEGKYMMNSNDPAGQCQVCPTSAVCPNQGPPVFQTSSIGGILSIDADPNDQEAIIASLAKTLGVDPALLVIESVDVRERRAGQSLEIAFKIYASADEASKLQEVLDSPDFVSSMSSSLAANNVSAVVAAAGVTSAPQVAEAPPGDWDEVDGTFFLRSCPPGFLLINTTLETQACRECEAQTFSVNSVLDCSDGRCDPRPCIVCPEGVACAKGSSPVWSHFAPKPLKLLDFTVPWVTVVQPSGTSSRLSCEAESQTCVPPKPSTTAKAAPVGDSDDEHVWEYSRHLNTFVLKICPSGFQLVNSSNGVFNPALQRCNPCGPTFYIIDRASSCRKCPKGATCPDGAQFIPNDWSEVGKENGSTWEQVRNSDGSMSYRVMDCPSGFRISYAADLPADDNCIK